VGKLKSVWEMPVSGRNFDYAAEIFDFIDGLDDLATPQDIVDTVAKTFSLFGFESFIITGLPNPKESFEHVVLLKRWPKGWFDIYSKADYVRSDHPSLQKHLSALRMVRSPLRSHHGAEGCGGHGPGYGFPDEERFLSADPWHQWL
jgi:hypothetical protein